MSEILYKSRISDQLKKDRKKYIAVFIIIVMLILTIIGAFLSPIIGPARNPFKPVGRVVIVMFWEDPLLTLIGGIPTILIIWFVLQYFGSYLIIYRDGVKIAKPFRLKRYKFIPWNSIKEIQIYNDDTIRNGKYFGALHLYLKNNQKALKISKLWIDKADDAFKIIIDYIKPLNTPEFCKYHPEIKFTNQCRSCGAYVCDDCIEYEEVNIRGNGKVYCNCSLCNFKVGLKRITIFYLISSILPLIALIIAYFNLFLDLENYLFGNVYLYQNAIGTRFEYSFTGGVRGIFSTFYAIISIFYIFSLNPYAIAFNIGNIKRATNFHRLNIKYSKKTFIFISFLGIIINLYYSIWYFYLHFAWLFGYVFWTLLIVALSLLWEYPGLKKYIPILGIVADS
ncbi:MAG: B-box zinc finger protein [Promethearchaeota archaeon]